MVSFFLNYEEKLSGMKEINMNRLDTYPQSCGSSQVLSLVCTPHPPQVALHALQEDQDVQPTASLRMLLVEDCGLLLAVTECIELEDDCVNVVVFPIQNQI